MLAELNGPMPGISLKIDLVVPVIIKDLPQAVYRPYRFDSLVGNTGEGFAVGIVPACPWHKGINQVFEMLVGQSQILPGVQIEAASIWTWNPQLSFTFALQMSSTQHTVSSSFRPFSPTSIGLTSSKVLFPCRLLSVTSFQ